MKLAVKSVIRSTQPHFECFQDQQVLFRAGNNLCLKSIGKADSEFICLDKNINKLYNFRPYTNRKGVFTAQRIGKDLYVSCYSLKSQRKAIQLTEQSSFLADVEHIQLLTDEYDNTVLYGAAKTKDTVCVFLADFNKLKILAVGYLPIFDDIKVDGRQNLQLSVCGHNGSYNYLKTLHYVSGQWEISEQPLKKIQQPLIQHELLFGNRIIMITSNSIHIMEDNEMVKSISVEEGSNIQQVIKIPKGLLVRLQNDVLKLMVQDTDQISYLMSSTITLPLQGNDMVSTIRTSHNNEQVWLQTKRKNYYVWRCDSIGLQLSSLDLVFNKVDTSCSNDDREGNISVSTGKKYALLTSCNSITLWSIQRNECVLSSEFLDPNDPSKRTLFAGAVNPDGNSLILAFEDKVKVFQILFTKFKQISQFHIKRCYNIVYSHGGQLVACRYGRGANSSIVVINLLRFNEVCTFKIQNEPHQIMWNELDDQLTVSSENASIQTYRISDQNRVHNIKLNETIVHARLDYKTRRLVVSTDQQIYVIENGQIIETIPHPFSDFSYVFPLYGLYLIAGKSGILYMCQSLKLEVSHQIPLFSQKPFNLLCRSSFLVAFSSFQDILVLKCMRPVQKKKDGSQQIVMIEKDEILNLFEKVKVIESNFDILTAATHIKLDQERHNYQNAIQLIKKKYIQELAFANSKFMDISVQKLKQEKESQRTFEDIEIGQNRNVNQLEKMYERKIDLQREKFMNLEQLFLQFKIESERRILELEARFNRDVNQIRNEYCRKSKEEAELVDKEKKKHLQDKKRVEYKILEIEEENEVVLTDLQKSKDFIISQLKIDLNNLEESYEKSLALLDTQKKSIKDYQDKAQLTKKELKRLYQSLEESENRVKLLQREIERRNKMIDERDQIIVQQGQQIGGLQKAKYVLSFRTTQIRKELQPKQSLIDKLKSELFKLDEEFKAEKKKNFELNQKLEKIEAVNIFSKREISDLKISLKCKERAHDEICSQIFMVINTIDPKDWNGEFIKIYQTHIKEDKHKNRRDKKKDDTVEEITRHLVHVEQSLVQVTAGTDRLLKGKDKEVVRKMKENSDLVYQLNVMRKKENEFQKEKKELINENARLKREAGDSVKTTTRAHTANTGFTRRVIASRQLNSRDKTATLDIQDLNISRKDMKEIRKQKNRLASARRTLMVQDDLKQKNGKFFDLAKQLQTARNTIRRQDRMIEELNHRLLGGPQLYQSVEQ